MSHVYGDTSGYSPKELTEELLARYRSGLTPANPGEVVLLVKEIDRLRESVTELLDETQRGG